MTLSVSQKSVVPLDTLIMGLGWFSIGLGLAELIAPRRVSIAAGMQQQNGVLRGYGLREIATGIGILASRNPGPWLWGRVAGDVLDVTTVAATADLRKQGRLGASFVALLGVGLLDLYTAMQSVPKQLRHPAKSEHDYSRRSGFSRSIEEMRGAALKRRQAQPGAARVAG